MKCAGSSQHVVIAVLSRLIACSETFMVHRRCHHEDAACSDSRDGIWVWGWHGAGTHCSPQGGLSAAPSRAVSAMKNINLPEMPRNISIGDINIKVPNLSQFM